MVDDRNDDRVFSAMAKKELLCTRLAHVVSRSDDDDKMRAPSESAEVKRGVPFRCMERPHRIGPADERRRRPDQIEFGKIAALLLVLL